MDSSPGEGLRDYGSFSYNRYDDKEAEEAHHRADAAPSLYVGMHFPGEGRRHHKKHKKRSSKKDLAEEDGAPRESFKPPSTPPSERVQFLIGQDAANDEAHEAHDLFCEMEELHIYDDQEMEWKETARWVKFEEDVEEGGDRWSKPFVATLYLHALFELRKGLMSGTCLLDMEASDLATIADLVIENMVASKQLDPGQSDNVRDALLSRHRHQYQKSHASEKKGSSKGLPIIRSLADIGKKHSEPKNLGGNDLKHNQTAPQLKGSASSGHLPKTESAAELSKTESGSELTDRDSSHKNDVQGIYQKKPGTKKSLKKSASFSIGSALGNTTQTLIAPSMRNESEFKLNQHFMKKIPVGAEASNILVGEVEFLQQPIIAFVRLNTSAHLGDLTEVPVPTRFLFILLGPQGNQKKYHEIGRSIATLMSDEVFHHVAYKARNRQHLVAGIDEFLDSVTVLPPGEWDPSIRIEPPKSVPSQDSRMQGQSMANGKANGKDAPDGGGEGGEGGGEDHGDQTLVRTGRIFGGLVADVKRKVPFYWSDVKDAFHMQSIASFVFLYFACLTPIITFGGLLGEATNNNMAAFESILAGAVCGCTYHLFSGQPLTIIGSTGPILVFETIAFSFCSDNGLDYLSFRFWIGTWTGVILLIMVAFDLSSLVRFITRFTEESFAALIALIFIYEAFSKLIKLEKQAHINFHALEPMNLECYCAAKNETHANDTSPVSTTPISPNTTNASYVDDYANVQWKLLPLELCEEYNGVLEGPGCKTPKYVADVFFFSCLLFLGTFFLAYSLKLFRNTRFFPNKVRVLISDFAVFLAIIAMVGLDIGMGFNTPKLTVPSEFRPTKEGRSWFVNPMKNPWWAIPAAILPALLCTILIFMDQQITAVIVNRKENKLKKGSGYHLDLFIIALQIVFCSMMGLPWFVAATVLSINHVNSLKIESETTAPGEKPQFLGVREQRVTGFCIFLFIGISILLTSILKYVPMPVLFGVFLYMGISSLKGVQFVQRLLIILMPTKYQPDYIFLRHVPVRRVHLFTLIQAVCLAILWTIKSIKSISIIFPLMVLAMCFVRKAMDWLFTQHDLKWLDDVMPETHKREKEDKKKKQIEALEKGEADELEMMGGTIQVPLQGGRLVNIPVDQIKYNPAKATVNISEEMAKTAIWKTLVSNESNPNIQDLDNNKPRKRKKKSKRKDAPGTIVEQEEPSPTKAPVKFSMGAEETEALIEYPEIRVSPPSEATTPNKESSNQEQTKL